MKRLYKFIIASFLGPFFLTFFIVIFLLLMQFLWRYIEDLAGKGLEFSVIAELMFYVSSSLVPMALPLAILLASLMTMGNLGENYELTAMKASGISLPRIVAPLVVFSVLLAIFAFFFSNYVLPVTNKKMTSLLWDITNSKPELQIKEGIFNNGLSNYSIRVGKKDYKTNMLYQIKIYDHTAGNGNTAVYLADSGYIYKTADKKFLFITLFNGYNYSEASSQPRSGYQTYPFRRDKFEKEVFRVPLDEFGLKRTDENLFNNNQRMMSLRQLRLFVDSFDRDIKFLSNNLYRTISSTNVMRYKPNAVKMLKDTAKKDTIKYRPFETAFNQLSVSERNSIINEALSFARDSKTTITNSSFSLDDKQTRLHRYEIEWWRKFTLSAGCLIFFFIGAPLGAIIRKGGLGMPVVISVLFFVLYYIISITGEKFAREGMVTAAVGMWLSAMILLPTGIFLTHKATHDSSIFNIDTYLNYWKNLRKKLRLRKSLESI
ncbi:MAG TPA: LptF/LptG family permease [Bacteroidales bacterium]